MYMPYCLFYKELVDFSGLVDHTPLFELLHYQYNSTVEKEKEKEKEKDLDNDRYKEEL